MTTEDLPTLRQTLQVLEQQHAALDDEEKMLESEVRAVLVLWWKIRVVERPTNTSNPVHPSHTDRKEEEGGRAERGPA